MLKDIFMFLITFFVIMLAFSCGVSYMYNYIGNAEGASTNGIFTYFFWVLLQPFRGNPDYDKVADLPYDTHCLSNLANDREEVNVKSIERCRMETMYNTTCMAAKMILSSKVTSQQLAECVISRRKGSENLQVVLYIVSILQRSMLLTLTSSRSFAKF